MRTPKPLTAAEQYERLSLALQQRRLDEFQQMLDAGYDVNFLPHRGFTLLKKAVYLGHEAKPWVMALLAAKANPNRGDSHDFTTPLLIAIDNWNIVIARMLLEAGASQLRRHTIGTTALHSAVSTSAGMCQLLINYGGDANAKNDHGETPLDYLIQTAKGGPDSWPVDIAQVLIDYGASYLPTSLNNKSAKEADYIRSILDHCQMTQRVRGIPLQKTRRTVPL